MMTLFVVYLISSALLLLLLTKGNRMEWLFKMTIVTFLPIIGWLMPSVWPKKWIAHNGQFFEGYMDTQSSDLTIQLLTTQAKVQREQELNIVAVEEALLISDVSVRRKVLIDILKQDAMQFIDVLKTAVTNEDTETSHYAVTAVIEVKRELTNLLQKLSVEFGQNPNDALVTKTYADVIREYLRSGFLDAQSTKQYQMTYIQLMQQLIHLHEATEDVFQEKIKMELTVNNPIAAEKTVALFKQQFPLCEEAYLSAMSIHFATRSYEKLNAELEALKSISITLSNKTLTTVRYWTEVTK